MTSSGGNRFGASRCRSAVAPRATSRESAALRQNSMSHWITCTTARLGICCCGGHGASRLPISPVVKNSGPLISWSRPMSLIPRPETERLVEIALQYAGACRLDLPVRILDIGTGSGAIGGQSGKGAAAGANSRHGYFPCGSGCARHNAARHRVADRVQFVPAILFDSIREREFDLIVSNPPYVESGELPLWRRRLVSGSRDRAGWWS